MNFIRDLIGFVDTGQTVTDCPVGNCYFDLRKVNVFKLVLFEKY